MHKGFFNRGVPPYICPACREDNAHLLPDECPQFSNTEILET